MRTFLHRVNPGFAGQTYLDGVDTKIANIIELRADRHISKALAAALA